MSNRSLVPSVTLPSFDTMVDCVGNPFESDLNLFLHGNQFMVVPELVAAFGQHYSQYRRVYYETLPPGLLVEQIRAGGRLQVGSLTLQVPADVYTGGHREITDLASALLPPSVYAQNHVVLLVAENNPHAVTGLSDLARAELRLALPNPQTEGIARMTEQLLIRAGGSALRDRVWVAKVKDGSTRWTTVHHRETLAWIENGQSDVGIVWASEAAWAIGQGHAVSAVVLGANDLTVSGQYWVAGLKQASHPEARDAFVKFLLSGEAQAIYQKYQFSPPQSPQTTILPEF